MLQYFFELKSGRSPEFYLGSGILLVHFKNLPFFFFVTFLQFSRKSEKKNLIVSRKLSKLIDLRLCVRV